MFVVLIDWLGMVVISVIGTFDVGIGVGDEFDP
jgi:hypothetical protein